MIDTFETDLLPETLEQARALDRDDPLSAIRARFPLPTGVIYLDGNSLGPPTVEVIDRIQRVATEEWREGLIRSWNDSGWMALPAKCGARIAPLIGADPDEVFVCDSVSVNVFKLAGALVQSNERAVIAVEQDEFPTDTYILEGLARLAGVEMVRLPAGSTPSDLPKGTTLLVKSVVHYTRSDVADIAVWEEAARDANLSIIWDLSHAAGLLDLDLKYSGARFAVGAGYKFLNGGPGAPSFVWVDRSRIESLHQPISGWLGHAEPFSFENSYRPAPGISRFAAGTPKILSMSALDEALTIFDSVDMRVVETKARRLGDFFLTVGERLGLEPACPRVGERRGAHVTFHHTAGYAIVQALIERGVIGDFRAPDLMRFGFSPLYLSWEDVWNAAEALREVVKSGVWKEPRFSERKAVT